MSEPASNIAFLMNILVVDDDINIRKMVAYCLENAGHKVVAVSNATDAAAEAGRRAFDLAFVDLRLGAERGLDLIPPLLATSPWLKVVVMTAFASIETAVSSMKSGSVDYLAKPFTPAQLRHITERIAALRRL
jgi:NtrC-family two-component system response regulator AlgB